MNYSSKRRARHWPRALRPLGITEFLDIPGQDGANGQFGFWLKEGEPRPDAVHVGFVAQSQAKVKEFFAAAVAAGASIKTTPGPQHQYFPGYLATWILDPDGHDIKVVNKTGQVE